MILIWVLLLINILFQNILHKIMIKRKSFSLNSGINFIVLRNGHSSGLRTTILDFWNRTKIATLHDPRILIYNHGYIVMIHLFNILIEFVQSTEHPVSYCLIFNLNVITIIFRLENHTLYFHNTNYHVYLWLEISPADNSTSYWYGMSYVPWYT